MRQELSKQNKYSFFNEIVQIVLYVPVLGTGKGREEKPPSKTNRFVSEVHVGRRVRGFNSL